MAGWWNSLPSNMEICTTKIHGQASPFRNLECPGDSQGSHENTWVHCMSLGLWRCWFERDLSIMRCTLISHFVDQKSLDMSISIYNCVIYIYVCVSWFNMPGHARRPQTDINGSNKRKKRQRRKKVQCPNDSTHWLSIIQSHCSANARDFKHRRLHSKPSTWTWQCARIADAPWLCIGSKHIKTILAFSSIIFHIVAHCPSFFGFHFSV